MLAISLKIKFERNSSDLCSHCLLPKRVGGIYGFKPRREVSQFVRNTGQGAGAALRKMNDVVHGRDISTPKSENPPVLTEVFHA